MTAPLVFADQAAFENAIGEYLRHNLTFESLVHQDTVDVGHGQYQLVKSHSVSVLLAGEPITEFTLD